jgi:hypothetical protein
LDSAYVPPLLIMLDEPELALEYMERAAEEPASYIEWSMSLVIMDQLRCGPRFAALLERLRSTDPRAATVCTKRA